MYIRYIAFKWHVETDLESVIPVLQQLGLNYAKKHMWTRSISKHTLLVEWREKMSSQDRSFFWIQWSAQAQDTQPGDLERILGDWFFAMRMHFKLTVNWMQVALNITVEKKLRSLYGYQERSPRIWSKTDKDHYFTFYPIKDHYYFEVRNGDIRDSIQHQQYILWLEELKYSLIGQEKPDDQLKFII
ncbi:hypothetical protein ABE82_26795 (plasmid) [Paenibacillus peoriae]|uniref:hypothetical protein n=1 Tax=Paenibacillus peoriae TaxID=59893 RepID=UPI0007212364|nr:hypothetical protein [Paenibacillus peoriae]ALS10017.1 hypothetical protein ABE82_26795 [Paenibacillus peoriae]